MSSGAIHAQMVQVEEQLTTKREQIRLLRKKLENQEEGLYAVRLRANEFESEFSFYAEQKAALEGKMDVSVLATQFAQKMNAEVFDRKARLYEQVNEWVDGVRREVQATSEQLDLALAEERQLGNQLQDLTQEYHAALAREAREREEAAAAAAAAVSTRR